MGNTVFLEKNNGHFEYFIYNFSEDEKKKVEVSNTVVARKAFQNVDSIEEVSFEKCIKIEEFSFENCKELKTVVWEKNHEEKYNICSIKLKCTSDGKEYNFDGKTNVNNTDKDESTGNIKGISIAETSELTIQHGAFKSCAKLQTVIFPIVRGKMIIEKEAFAGCSELRTVVFYGSWNVDINEEVFLGCSDVTFLCIANSPAERYAREHGFRIVSF